MKKYSDYFYALPFLIGMFLWLGYFLKVMGVS